MMNKKLRVVIICNFSNPKIQEKLNLKMRFWEFALRKLLKKQTDIDKLVGEYGMHFVNTRNW